MKITAHKFYDRSDAEKFVASRDDLYVPPGGETITPVLKSDSPNQVAYPTGELMVYTEENT